MIKVIKERWQVRFNPSLIGVIPLVRRNGRGPWLSVKNAPPHVGEFLDIEPDTFRMDRVRWPNVAAVKENAQEIKWQTTRNLQGFITIDHKVEGPPPIPKGSGPLIKSLEDLCNYFSADEPRLLNKRIYKGTDCGASLSLYLTDGKAIHNGDRAWDSLPITTPINGFTIQTIVEGSDATVDSDLFWIPCPEKWVAEWCEEMEGEASALWDYK